MSDGGERRNREGEQKARKRSRPEDFCRAVAKIAVAQVCEGVGLEGIKQSVLEALSDIAVRYICDLGKSAEYYANLAGRSQSSVFDVVKGLEDLGSTRGFPGASGVDCCAIDSGALKEVIDYVGIVEEIPFARPIPQFPVSSTSEMHSFSQLGESPSEKHIPEWLPVFPDPHTYLNSPVSNERQVNTHVDNAERIKRQRKSDISLLRLQQRLLSGTSAGPSGNYVGGLQEAGASEDNQFLAPPLQAGEKEVSQITFPARLVNTEGNKKHGPFVEIFAPANDATKERESDSMDNERRLPLERKPVVHFRLKTGKKMLSENVDVGLRGRGGEGRVPAPYMDEEKDEKKRRAVQMLKQSMVNLKGMSQNGN